MICSFSHLFLFMYSNTVTATIMWHIGFLLLLLLASDIEPNPGPVKDPCGVCTRRVTWKNRGVICDGCETWFHATCVNMCDACYNAEQSNVSWYCWTCGLPHFASELFASESVHLSLADISRASSLSSAHPSSPSSPKTVK